VPEPDLGREDVDGDGAAPPRKKTRRGSRGGRRRKKKVDVAANGAGPEEETGEAVQLDEAVAVAVSEPAAELDSGPGHTPDGESDEGDDETSEWRYVPMSEWGDDFRR
jgi:hypothetical protein